MSQYLDLLEVGDTVDIRGPSGKLTCESEISQVLLLVSFFPPCRESYVP